MKITAMLFILLLAGCAQTLSPATLPEALPRETIVLADGDTLQLEAHMVRTTINGKNAVMLAYNKQLPGPLLKVKQNSTITVNFKNSLQIPTTVHWHGIRLENKYDGVPDVTQKEVAPGETFEYVLRFPDDGIYWYHPHIREDMQQELGLYGNILVEPLAPYPPAGQEEVLIIDDVLLSENGIEEFSSRYATHALMGRFGNQMLVNWQTNYTLSAKTGETVRFYLTDAANTRPFNISITNTPLKVIGGDSGLYEKEYFADSVILSPGERVIFDVVFNEPGTYQLINKNPYKKYTLGTVTVTGEKKTAKQSLNQHSINIERLRSFLDSPPDYEIVLTNTLHGMGGMMMDMGGERIEWEDTMPMMNYRTTSGNIKWILRDKKTGKENMDAYYEARVGDIKKIRFINDARSMHPMQHPMHLHGQRFLVVSENGRKPANYVWKDTVTVPTGETVDILVEFTNPGDWVFHCHIAEHLETGMMSMFTVKP